MRRRTCSTPWNAAPRAGNHARGRIAAIELSLTEGGDLGVTPPPGEHGFNASPTTDWRRTAGGNVRIVVGLAGSSAPIYGIRTLQALKEAGVETHLVVSDGAKRTIPLETHWTMDKIEALATVVYPNHELAASISSGSFQTDGMIIAPCSMKTLAGIAYSFSQDLLVRAADVTLKERRKLVLVPRETPLHLGHLRNMVRATEMGAVILPPVPAFYHQPKTVEDLIDQTVGKILDQFHIEHTLFRRWRTPGGA